MGDSSLLPDGPTLLGVERYAAQPGVVTRVTHPLTYAPEPAHLAAAWALLLVRYADQPHAAMIVERHGARHALVVSTDRQESSAPWRARVAAALDAPGRSVPAEWRGGSVLVLQGPPGPWGSEDLRVSVEASALVLEASTSTYDRDALERTAGHLDALLRALADTPDQPLARLPMLSAAEREFLLHGVQSPPTAYPRDACCHRLFEAHVRRDPHHPAVRLGDERWTYDELNRRANRVARVLRSQGVREGDLVGVCVLPSPLWLAALLGVVKAGGAYVGIDPLYPPARQQYMLEDSGARLVLTQRALADTLVGATALALDDERWGWATQDDTDLSDTLASGSLLYRMYTSGSTGRPKCVGVSHRNIVRMLVGSPWFVVTPEDRVAQAASTSFDVSVFESWSALLNGAELVITPKDVLLTPQQLERFVREAGLTCLFLTTGLFNRVALLMPHIFAGLHNVSFGGDVVDPSAIRAIQRAGAPQNLINAYGPTEHGVFCCSYRVPPLSDDVTLVPIGHPLPNDRVYVLDRHRQLMPIGVKGELMAGGDGTSPVGYNDPEVNAERWIDDPFTPGGKLYRTGDQARVMPSGLIEFHGRNDHQVKIRGFRVELPEIQGALTRHPAVRTAVVVAREDTPGTKTLAAYVVLREPVDSATLEAFLRTSLPPHMIPTAIVPMDALPLTANGKVDRGALPKPVVHTLGPTARTPTEASLSAILRKILQVEEVDVEANFFGLGLTSIQVMQFLAEAVRSGHEVTAAQVFAHPTLAELARLAEAPKSAPPRAGSSTPAGSTARVRATISDAIEEVLPASAPQLPHLARSLTRGGVGVFSEQTVHELEGPLDEPRLQQALADTIAAHAVLRTALRFNPKPVQLIRREVELPWTSHDFSALDAAAQARAVHEVVGRLSREGHPLAVAPLARAVLCRLGPTRAQLIWSVHAPICDGWSQQLLVAEVFARYEALCAARPFTPPPARSFRDYEAWARAQVLPPEAEAFWRASLRQAPVSLGQLARTAKAMLAPPADVLALPERGWSAELDAELKDWLRAERLSQGALLHALFALVLAKHTGREDVLFATMVSGRMSAFPGIDTVIGMVGSPLPFRVRVRRDQRVAEFVHEVQAVLSGVCAHEWVSQEQLVKLARRPLAYDCVLAVQSHESMALSAPGATVRVTVGERSNNYAVPLALEVNPPQRRWHLYATKPVLRDVAEAHTVAGHFERMLSSVSGLSSSAQVVRLMEAAAPRTRAASPGLRAPLG